MFFCIKWHTGLCITLLCDPVLLIFSGDGLLPTHHLTNVSCYWLLDLHLAHYLKVSNKHCSNKGSGWTWFSDLVMLFWKRRCRFWYSWCYLLRLDGFLRVSSLHIYKWMMHAYAWYWAKRMFTASIRSTLLPIHWFLIQHLWHLAHLVFQLLLWPILLDCLLWACQLWWVVNYLLSVFFSQSMQLHSLQASEQDF